MSTIALDAALAAEPLCPAALEAYVRSSAQLLGLPLCAAEVVRVAEHLRRTVAMAALLDGFAMPAEQEPVGLFCPAPFPHADS